MSEDELELSLETLDEWETELDQFAAGVSRRLLQLSGNATSGSLVNESDETSDDESGKEILDGHEEVDDPETQNLIQSIRELRQ